MQKVHMKIKGAEVLLHKCSYVDIERCGANVKEFGLLPHTEVGLYSPPCAYEAALTRASNLKSSYIWNFSS